MKLRITSCYIHEDESPTGDRITPDDGVFEASKVWYERRKGCDFLEVVREGDEPERFELPDDYQDLRKAANAVADEVGVELSGRASEYLEGFLSDALDADPSLADTAREAIQ